MFMLIIISVLNPAMFGTGWWFHAQNVNEIAELIFLEAYLTMTPSTTLAPYCSF